MTSNVSMYNNAFMQSTYKFDSRIMQYETLLLSNKNEMYIQVKFAFDSRSCYWKCRGNIGDVCWIFIHGCRRELRDDNQKIVTVVQDQN